MFLGFEYVQKGHLETTYAGGATHVEIACDPELVKLALSLTSLPAGAQMILKMTKDTRKLLPSVVLSVTVPHSVRCQTNEDDEKILPNGTAWIPNLVETIFVYIMATDAKQGFLLRWSTPRPDCEKCESSGRDSPRLNLFYLLKESNGNTFFQSGAEPLLRRLQYSNILMGISHGLGVSAQKILAPGGAKVLLSSFLGREPSVEAYIGRKN